MSSDALAFALGYLFGAVHVLVLTWVMRRG